MAKRKSDVKEQTPEVPVPASGSVSEATKVVQQEKKEATTKAQSCGECRFYDHSTEREFRRNGIRQGLVETRAVCKASAERSKASHHLVKRESNTSCFEAGVYVLPVKEEKAREQKKTAEAQTHKASNKDKTTRAVATNGLAGDTKVLEQNGHDKKVVVKKIA